MAWQYVTADSIGTLTRVSLGTTDSAYIGAGVHVVSTDGSDAIAGTGSGQSVIVHGHVAGNYAIYLGAAGAANISVSVQAGGTVTATGGTGISILANSSVVNNAGSVFGAGAGIFINGDYARIVNTGLVETTSPFGSNAALIFFSDSNNPGTEAEAVNHGRIVSAYMAIRGDIDFGDRFYNFGSVVGHTNQGGGDDLLLNRGSILGNVVMEAGADRVDNRNGEIDGGVYLGTGDDRYDGQGGTVTGQILGDAGNDTFILNAATDDYVDGGADADTIDFRFGPAVVVALDASFDNDGGAAGDTFLNIERVNGSAFADVIRGSTASNMLTGFAGNDLIDGAAGSDLLRGGIGVDTLVGGLGNDNFYFYTAAEMGDTIADFNSTGSGNDDRFSFRAANFGAGLVAGALDPTQFQSRADNLAQDSNDRFIFRTTDTTLWFDADGNGAGAAVLVADLQAGATMTSLDIVLV